MNSRNISILLFVTSSIVIMASSSAPLRRYLRRRISSVDTKKTKKIKYSRFSSDKDPLDHGVLVIKSSDDFKSNAWRGYVSIMDAESEDKQVNEDDLRCELEVINDYGKIITICWVSDKGTLHHYYPINDGSIRDGSVRNNHVEYTSAGHSFVAFLQQNDETIPKSIRDIKSNRLIFLYRPNSAQARHILRVRCVDAVKEEATVELICRPIESQELIDTTDKEYIMEEIAGFVFHCEPNVFDCNESLRETLEFDLAALSSLLPNNVLLALQRDMAFWLNASMCYGPKSNPVNATSCTYHEIHGQEWLRRNGLSELKAGCVEIFSAKEYLKTRDHWGIGGLLLHELMHCVHDHYAEGRYDCKLIRDAYQRAMHAKLYDAVGVHGPQGKDGKRVKAYACANCMEFFAELSVAYLWDVDTETEYNKWFPHNRYQLREHDVDTFNSLHTFWETVNVKLGNP
jgi:hypothetical protein